MSNDRYIIKSQRWDLEVPDEHLALNIRQNFGELVTRKITPMLEAICRESVPRDQVIRIDRLELDIGNIAYAKMEDELAKIVKDVFRKALTHEISKAAKGDENPYVRDSPDGSDLELIRFYLYYGSLPWWASLPESSPDKAVDRLFHSGSFKKLIPVIQKGISVPSFRKRISHLFTDKHHAMVLGVLQKDIHEGIRKEVNDFSQLNKMQWAELYRILHILKDSPEEDMRSSMEQLRTTLESKSHGDLTEQLFRNLSALLEPGSTLPEPEFNIREALETLEKKYRGFSIYLRRKLQNPGSRRQVTTYFDESAILIVIRIILEKAQQTIDKLRKQIFNKWQEPDPVLLALWLEMAASQKAQASDFKAIDGWFRTKIGKQSQNTAFTDPFTIFRNYLEYGWLPSPLHGPVENIFSAIFTELVDHRPAELQDYLLSSIQNLSFRENLIRLVSRKQVNELLQLLLGSPGTAKLSKTFQVIQKTLQSTSKGNPAIESIQFDLLHYISIFKKKAGLMDWLALYTFTLSSGFREPEKYLEDLAEKLVKAKLITKKEGDRLTHLVPKKLADTQSLREELTGPETTATTSPSPKTILWWVREHAYKSKTQRKEGLLMLLREAAYRARLDLTATVKNTRKIIEELQRTIRQFPPAIEKMVQELNDQPGISQSESITPDQLNDQLNEMLSVLDSEDFTEVPTPGELKTRPKELSKKEPRDEPVEELPDFYIRNAGLVILWPFLAKLFESLQLTVNNEFRDFHSIERATHLLQYLGSGDPNLPEYHFLLSKVLCGLSPEEFVDPEITLTDEERKACEELLTATIAHWPPLKSTSNEGFREAFLQREGKLIRKDKDWLLQVEQKAYDVLFEKLPWGISTIKLPWNDYLIHTEW